MASFDDLDAPQYSTFEDVDPKEVETYFEIDHENLYNQVKKKLNKTNMSGRLWSSQDNISNLPKTKKIHSSSGNVSKPQEFVSLAEAVKKFQDKTPTRFRSRVKSEEFKPNCVPMKLKLTMAQSPKLLTKRLVRPTAPIMTQQEREEAEFQEAQKLKYKARPLNKRVLQPLKAIHVEKKPTTQPEPFKLTKTEPKKTLPSPQNFKFHANPVPKSVLEPPKPIEKPAKITQPTTPTFMKNKKVNPSPVKKVEKKPPSPLKTTKPEPFSFEKRDVKIMQRKEEFIQKFLDEEKKAREFHARPIPKPVVSIIKETKEKVTSSTSIEMKKSNEDIREEQFKARPATVLYQKPFEVKKPVNALTEIQPFQLQTDVRAKEREIFEEKKKQMELRAAELRRQEEEENLRREQEEIRRQREQATFKANPIKNFKEIQIKPSGKVTQPISPVFRSGKQNKENIEKI